MPPPRQSMMPSGGYFLVIITDDSAAPAYQWQEVWYDGTAYIEKEAGLFGGPDNPGISLGAVFAVDDYALCRSAAGAGGLVWELFGIPSGHEPDAPTSPIDGSIPVMDGDGDLDNTALQYSASPVNGDPATQYTQSTAPGATLTTAPHLFQQVAQDGDGSGTPTITVQAYPEGTAGASPYKQTITPDLYQEKYAPAGDAPVYVTVKDNGSGATQFVTGNAAGTQGEFSTPTISSSNFTAWTDSMKLWDSGASTIRTATTTYTVDGSGNIVVTYGAGYKFDFSAAAVTGISGTTGWQLVKTILYTDLTAGSTSQNIAAYTLAAKEGLERFLVRTKTAAVASGLSSLQLALRVNGTTHTPPVGDGKTANDIGCNGSYPLQNTDVAVFSWTGTTAVEINFLASGANLNTLTAGEWEVWLKTDVVQ